MAVRKKLVRSNLFAFPGTAPGFSQGHIAAASIYNWSAVALGAAMVGVIGGTAGQVGTIGAGPLAAKIDSIIGPATVFTTAQSINPPALTQLVAYQGTTFAAIVNLTNVASGAFFSNTTSAANGINMGPNTGALQLLVNGSFACTGSGVSRVLWPEVILIIQGATFWCVALIREQRKPALPPAPFLRKRRQRAASALIELRAATAWLAQSPL